MDGLSNGSASIPCAPKDHLTGVDGLSTNCHRTVFNSLDHTSAGASDRTTGSVNGRNRVRQRLSDNAERFDCENAKQLDCNPSQRKREQDADESDDCKRKQRSELRDDGCEK